MHYSKQQKHPLNLIGLLLLLLVFVGVGNISAQDKSAASVYNEALAKLKAKDYEAGYPLMEEALKAAESEGNEKVLGLAKKNGAKAAYNLGASKRKAKAYDEALTLFDRGIELNPEYSSNYMGKAQALDSKGAKVEAVSAFLAAADLASAADKADRAAQLTKKASSIVGKLYTGKTYDKAIEAGKAFLAVKDNANVHYYLAKSLEKKKDMATASTHILKAVELAEASGTAVPDKYYWAKGNILEANQQKQQALDAYKKISGEKYKANADYKIKELGGS